MAEPNRVPLTVRLRPDDKDYFAEAANLSGLEPGIAARTVLEIVIKHMRSENSDRNFFEALGELQRTLEYAKQRPD